jgi:Fe-S-cluster-containing hydrogenase component 2
VGEIGLIAFSEADLNHPSLAHADAKLASLLASSEPFPVGKRTATCSALGALEMARVSRADFLQLVREHPAFRLRLVEQTLARLKSNSVGDALVHEYVENGLYEGQSILVLDTELCTRCDECTKACVEQHGTKSHGVPMTRLLRDGVRLSSFVVATSCRSCLDPHCMFGCPVDAIHRGKHLQIVIEDHCIGCGLCAKNCPYGSIFMVPNEHKRISMSDPVNPGKSFMVAQKMAAACDLCDSEGERDTPDPRCVAACPHEAAQRMTGVELLSRARQRDRRA